MSEVKAKFFSFLLQASSMLNTFFSVKPQFPRSKQSSSWNLANKQTINVFQDLELNPMQFLKDIFLSGHVKNAALYSHN